MQHLEKDHYKVTVLSAIATYANDHFFPLAYIIVLGEARLNWRWFLYVNS
jgi:hypothetical protein